MYYSLRSERYRTIQERAESRFLGIQQMCFKRLLGFCELALRQVLQNYIVLIVGGKKPFVTDLSAQNTQPAVLIINVTERLKKVPVGAARNKYVVKSIIK